MRPVIRRAARGVGGERARLLAGRCQRRAPGMAGKFMAFTQQGTTLHGDGIHPTCLNYLKRLGVKYVQLMPIFDFGSVDEAKPLLRQYNWGYDPTNYNVPEGSYSTDPTRGEVRIRECREMIAALHAAGIGVVMDVVYNHMYRSENPLNDTVPCYFFRQNEDGSFSNGSGCGNEFASERPMARRYMIDSILCWAQEYHIDGFRFDLMGLYDVETINAVRAALDTLPGGRDILMYGEPWQGGGSQLHRYEANKANLAMLNERIGIFCDDTRDTIKGGCFTPGSRAMWRAGPAASGTSVAQWRHGAAATVCAPRASQIVSYVSAHDNFTLWDKLLLVRYEKPEFTAADSTALAQNRLAAGIYLTSFGLPFLQAGEEFARTKKGKGNSYRSSPALNRLDWERAEKYHALVDYYRGLLALRARFPRLSSTDPTRRMPVLFSLEQPLVGCSCPPSGATAQHGRRCACSITPPRPARSCRCRLALADAERRHLVQPVARPGKGVRARDRADALQCHHLWTDIKTGADGKLSSAPVFYFAQLLEAVFSPSVTLTVCIWPSRAMVMESVSPAVCFCIRVPRSSLERSRCRPRSRCGHRPAGLPFRQGRP